MSLSVVTLTWNSENYIYRMLDTLTNNLNSIKLNYEIIIVDNGSDDNTVSILCEYMKKNKNINLIALESNVGTTKSRNLALKQVNYENILIVDSDTEFTYTNFEKLLKSFSEIKSEKIGIIQPRLVHTNGEIQSSALKFPTITNKFFRFLGRTQSPYDLKDIQKVDYCISAAWLLKREVFEVVGLLDEKIFYAPEDAEFCKRLSTLGLEVWYYPNVQIIHHYQRITSKKKINKMWFSHLKGLIYFWFKY